MKRCYNNTVNQWACSKGPLLLCKKERVKMKYCPYCGADIPDGAVSFALNAGKHYRSRRRNQRSQRR